MTIETSTDMPCPKCGTQCKADTDGPIRRWWCPNCQPQSLEETIKGKLGMLP